MNSRRITTPTVEVLNENDGPVTPDEQAAFELFGRIVTGPEFMQAIVDAAEQLTTTLLRAPLACIPEDLDASLRIQLRHEYVLGAVTKTAAAMISTICVATPGSPEENLRRRVQVFAQNLYGQASNMLETVDSSNQTLQ